MVKYKFVLIIPENTQMEQNIIYISEKYKTASHLCLCGCNRISVTPIHTGKWIKLIDENKISMQPSILNNNCPNRSHYVVTKNIANII